MDPNNRPHHDEISSWKPVTSGYGSFLTKSQARSWALVLDSRSIPCCIEPDGERWLLLVPEQQLESACRELRLYEEANSNWPPPLPAARQLIENTLPTLSILILLATFHNLNQLGISLPGRGIIDLNELGAAHAEKILGGQLWQCITALTLHADLMHLLSNLTIGGFFIILLCRELGSGLAWSLLLGSGALGNLINAWVQSPAHRSVGASTAVFGAVGILAAISMVRYRHHLQRRWFIPVAAGLALLAILGTEGKNTDLGAHLFGFCFGILFGIGAEFLVGKFGRPGSVMNTLLAVLSAVLVGAAWWAAITWGG
ncbi:MAG: rhomboid family intramembrane serine protease [Geobacteraceae bacterium]|nr:rhomboid family intramembrane serine protease [Geobacteraceae bacterium]